MVTTTVESKIRDLLTMTPKRSIVDTSLKLAGVMVLVYSKEGVYHMMFNRRSHQVAEKWIGTGDARRNRMLVIIGSEFLTNHTVRYRFKSG